PRVAGRIATAGFEIPVTAGADTAIAIVIIDRKIVIAAKTAADVLFVDVIQITYYYLPFGHLPGIIWRDVVPGPVADTEIIAVPDNGPGQVSLLSPLETQVVQ